MNKAELLELVKQKISEKIQKLEQLIAETRASNNDTKKVLWETSMKLPEKCFSKKLITFSFN